MRSTLPYTHFNGMEINIEFPTFGVFTFLRQEKTHKYLRLLVERNLSTSNYEYIFLHILSIKCIASSLIRCSGVAMMGSIRACCVFDAYILSVVYIYIWPQLTLHQYHTYIIGNFDRRVK